MLACYQLSAPLSPLTNPLIQRGRESAIQVVLLGSKCFMGRHSLAITKTLSSKQKRAAELLAHGMKAKHVAEELGIHYVSLSRWRNLCPAFQNEMRMHYSALYQQSMGRAMQLAEAGQGVLAGILKDKEASPAVRCSAAQAALNDRMRLLEHELRVAANEQLQRRVEALEKRQEQIVDIEATRLDS